MPGKKHNQTCDFIDKVKCCKKKQNRHFEFHAQRLNTINAVKELRNILKNKKLLLLGDSLMVELFYGLAELLGVKIRMSACKRLRCSIHPGKNAIKACKISLTGQQKQLPNMPKDRIYSEEAIRREIPKYDVIVVNQGLHYDLSGTISENEVQINNVGQMLFGKDLNPDSNLSFSTTIMLISVLSFLTPLQMQMSECAKNV